MDLGPDYSIHSSTNGIASARIPQSRGGFSFRAVIASCAVTIWFYAAGRVASGGLFRDEQDQQFESIKLSARLMAQTVRRAIRPFHTDPTKKRFQ